MVNYQNFRQSIPTLEYGSPTPDYRVNARNLYDKADRINIMSLLKVGLVIVAVVLLFVFGTGLIQRVKKFFGLNGGLLNLSLGGDGGLENKTEQQLQKDVNDTILAGARPPYTHYNKYLTPKNIHVDTRSAIDTLVRHQEGYHVSDVSKTINPLANRNKAELILAVRYFDEMYASQSGNRSLYDYLRYSVTGQPMYGMFTLPSNIGSSDNSVYKTFLKRLEYHGLKGKAKVIYPDRKAVG